MIFNNLIANTSKKPIVKGIKQEPVIPKIQKRDMPVNILSKEITTSMTRIYLTGYQSKSRWSNV